MYNLENIFLLLAGLINLFMTVFILSRGWKNKINLYFGLLTFFNFTWALGLFLSRLFVNLDITLFFSRSTYISAIFIVISLLYFTLHFPYKIKKISLFENIVIWLSATYFILIIYTNYFIETIVSAYSDYEYILYFNNLNISLYTIYFILLTVISIYNLIIKYSKADQLFKKQIGFLLVAILIGLGFGSFFDLFITLSNNFKYNWLGPIFTLFMNGAVFYLIKSANEK